MKNLYDVIARRSLNHAKNLNPIIYLTIRSFFDSFSKKARTDEYIKEFIERKLYIRNNWPTKQYKLFKERKADNFEYRDILSLSAFGIIAESYLMMKISESKYIENKSYVFSYLLPNPKSSRNYEYYFTGYKKRNRVITEAFRKNPDYIAVVLDLTKFYPSINKNSVENIFQETIGKNEGSELSKLSQKIIHSMLEQSISGVPIGTNLSHLLAQVYLLGFDEKLNQKFPNLYFRYVDDIVILCKREEEQYVKDYVVSSLPQGLDINNTKTDILCLEDWMILNKNHDAENENLHDILHFITAYLAMHPKKIDDLAKEISQAGYSIPLKRIRQQTKNRMFMLFLKSFLKKKKKYTPFEIYFTKPTVIIGKLLAIKKFYIGKFNELIKLKYDDTNSAENRSNTQQLKYIINRLLYLSTIDELYHFMQEVPNTEKFQDTKEVIYALSTKDLRKTIQYGGKVVQTVCELWNENNFEPIFLSKKDFIEIPNLNDIVDSVIIMYLYKVIKFEIIDILGFLDQENKEYIQVILDSSYKIKNTNNKFLLEIEGLLKNKSLDLKYELLTTRYDDKQEIQLAGLDLGLGYSL